MKSIIKSELINHSDTFNKLAEMEEEILNLYENFRLAIQQNKKILKMSGFGPESADLGIHRRNLDRKD